VPHNFPV